MANRKRRSNEFIGRIGDTTFYLKNGKVIGRTSTNQKITKARTTKQKESEQRFGTISRLLARMRVYTNIGFGIEAKKTSKAPWNMAVGENKRNAFKGIYPNLELDYPALKLSIGQIPVNPGGFEMEITATGIRVKWNPTEDLPGMRPEDRIMLLAYSPEKNGERIELSGAKRREGVEELRLMPYSAKHLYHVYASFRSYNGMLISDSMYLGKVNFGKVDENPTI